MKQIERCGLVACITIVSIFIGRNAALYGLTTKSAKAGTESLADRNLVGADIEPASSTADTAAKIEIAVPELDDSHYEGTKEGLRQKINEVSAELHNQIEQIDKWIELGLLKIDAGDYTGARMALEYASALDTENAQSFNYLGQLYYSKFKLYSAAEANWRMAIKNDALNHEPYIGLSELYQASNNPLVRKEALSVLEAGRTQIPESPDILFALARYYKQAGNKKEAARYASEALREALKLQLPAEFTKTIRNFIASLK